MSKWHEIGSSQLKKGDKIKIIKLPKFRKSVTLDGQKANYNGKLISRIRDVDLVIVTNNN